MKPRQPPSRAVPGRHAASAKQATATPAKLLDFALARRAAFLTGDTTDAWRVFNGVGDGLDGLVLEKLGPVLIAQLHEGRLALAEADARALCVRAAEAVRATAIYRKQFVRDRSGQLAAVAPTHTDPRPWWGEPAPEEFAVHEHGLRYLVRPYDGYSTGLFLEHRDNRQRVRQLAAGRRVLNTFAYTCAYSVAAAAGGAAEVVSVDIARKALAWGQRNFAANMPALRAGTAPGFSDLIQDDPAAKGLDPNKLAADDLAAKGLAGEDLAASGPAAGDRDATGYRFVAWDTLEYLNHAFKRGWQFDLIILDPPSFARRGHARERAKRSNAGSGRASGPESARRSARRPFVFDEELDALVAGAVAVLAPGGHLLLCTNHRPTTRAALEAAALGLNAPAGGTARSAAAVGLPHARYTKSGPGAARPTLRVAERPPLPPDFAGDADYAKSVWLVRTR